MHPELRPAMGSGMNKVITQYHPPILYSPKIGTAGLKNAPPFPPLSPSSSDAEKLARCEQCLRLLSFALWAPGAAGRAASYLADAEGAALLLLRAVLTGVELAEASAADDWWQVRCRPCP